MKTSNYSAHIHVFYTTPLGFAKKTEATGIEQHGLQRMSFSLSVFCRFCNSLICKAQITGLICLSKLSMNQKMHAFPPP